MQCVSNLICLRVDRKAYTELQLWLLESCVI